MKKQHIGFLMVIIGMCNACSTEQEFLTQKSNKKKYVSEQQDLEMDGDITTFGPNITGVVADLLKTVSLITKSSVNRINDHMDGKKNGLGKVGRTECYAIKKNIQQELDDSIKEIKKIEQRLSDYQALLDQKIQIE
jgi:hypothetical protein